MPKLGMEPIRRAALVQAAIAEIGHAGSLDVTVGNIARRAGVSAALAHHYFGAKDQIFLAAMRQILSDYGRAVRAELAHAEGPRARLDAILRASFAPQNYGAATVMAWLNFYVLARASPEAMRLLTIYRRRLRANLLHDLRPLAGLRAGAIADTLAALIDGQYLQGALLPGSPDGPGSCDRVNGVLDALLQDCT